MKTILAVDTAQHLWVTGEVAPIAKAGSIVYSAVENWKSGRTHPYVTDVLVRARIWTPKRGNIRTCWTNKENVMKGTGKGEKEMNKIKIQEWLKETDGYSVMEPEFFLEMGVPKEIVENHTRTHSSDPSLGKGAVTRNDGSGGDVKGVAEFGMVNTVARLLGVKPVTKWMGRGKNFRETTSVILESINWSE